METTRKRVCFLVPTHWDAVMGGAQYQAKLLFEHIAPSERFDIHYLARRLPADTDRTDHTMHKIGNSRGADFLFDTRTLLNKLTELDPDTIYHQVGGAHTGVAAWYCRRHKARLVWHIASDVDVEPWKPGRRRNLLLSYADKKVLEYGIRHADAIVGQSEHQRTLLKRNYGRDLTALIRNFHPPVTETIDKSGRLRVVWIANLKDVKQPELFVDLARALADVSDAEFIMIGGMQFDADRAARLEQRVAATPNLLYTGELTQAEVNAHLATSHLLVNTSKYEGFSNTFVQAWQREVPVCALGVNPDNLLDGTSLGIACNDDFETLVRRVRALLESRSRMQEMGAAARRHADAEHGLQNAERMAELF